MQPILLLVEVVGLLNVSMYVFVSMVLVSLSMESLFMSVTHCGLRCSLIFSREYDARSGDFITPCKNSRVGRRYVFMFSFPNCFHFSIFSDCFCFVVCTIMVLFIAFSIDWFAVCFYWVFFLIRNGDSLVIGVSSVDSSTMNW